MGLLASSLSGKLESNNENNLYLASNQYRGLSQDAIHEILITYLFRTLLNKLCLVDIMNIINQYAKWGILDGNKLKPINVAINNAAIHNNITFYELTASNESYQWYLSKRYSQFEYLHNQLLQLVDELNDSGIHIKLPFFPSKHSKLFTNHKKDTFIEERHALLNNYIKKLIKIRYIQTAKMRYIQTAECMINFFSESIVSFEKYSEREKSVSPETKFPEDQQVTHITIESTRKMTDHVLYQMCVSNEKRYENQRSSFRRWTVLKRYCQFYDMDCKLRASLQQTAPEILSKLPPAPDRKFKFVHDHMEDDFIEKRRVLMEHYLSTLLKFPDVAKNESFLEFLGVDIDYF